MQLFDITEAALSSAIGAAGMRQQVLSNNVANVNTPGFKRSDVSFDDILSKALERDGTKRERTSFVESLTGSVSTESGTSMRVDGNNVDIDKEMALLAENQVRYNALVQVASKRMDMLRSVIMER